MILLLEQKVNLLKIVAICSFLQLAVQFYDIRLDPWSAFIFSFQICSKLGIGWPRLTHLGK